MSPTYFAVRNARLDKEFEAARLAGDPAHARIARWKDHPAEKDVRLAHPM